MKACKVVQNQSFLGYFWTWIPLERTPHLSELIVWTCIIIQSTATTERNYDETTFLSKLFNVKHFWKKLTNKYDTNLTIYTILDKLLQNSLHLSHGNISGLSEKKRALNILFNFVIYWHFKWTKRESRTFYEEMPL